MEFSALPALLRLDPGAWSLLLGFLTFSEEPRDRIPHLCRMDERRVKTLLPSLVRRGLVRSRRVRGGRLYSLAPIDAWPFRKVPTAGRAAQELAQLRRVIELRGQPALSVIGTGETRDRTKLVPEIARYAATVFPNIDLRVGTSCNLNCVYCLLGHEDRYLRPAAEIIKDLTWGRARNLEKVAFTGGEPTLHPDLLRLVAVARTLGYRQVVLVTNGVTLGYRGRLADLREAGVTALGISFDTPDRATAEAMWRSPVHAMVVRAFHAAAAFPEMPVGSIAVVTAYNYRQLPDLARFYAEMKRGMKNLFVPNLDCVMPEENAWLNRAEVVPRLSEVIPYVREALETAHRSGVPLTHRGFPPCLLPGLGRYDFGRYMSIFRLVRAPEGPVFDRVSLDLWRVKGPQCRRCRLDRGCPGVYRSYANLHGVDELTPVEGAS